MKTHDFNDSGRLPTYTYRRSPIGAHAYQILKFSGGLSEEAQPVGEYTVLDKDEDALLSEKKVMNVVSALNGREKLIQLGEKTKSRQLFHILNDGSDGLPMKIMFSSYDGTGVSVESALLMMERPN